MKLPNIYIWILLVVIADLIGEGYGTYWKKKGKKGKKKGTRRPWSTLGWRTWPTYPPKKTTPSGWKWTPPRPPKPTTPPGWKWTTPRPIKPPTTTRRTTKQTTTTRTTTKPPTTTTRSTTKPPTTTRPTTKKPTTTTWKSTTKKMKTTTMIRTPTTTMRTTTSTNGGGWGWGKPTTAKGWGTPEPEILIKVIIPDIPGKDCCQHLRNGYEQCGFYEIEPTSGTKGYVYCDMKDDGGGWTVLFRREPIDGPKTNFYLNQKSYELGFGNPYTTFWLGLKTMAKHLESNDQELKICLETFAGEKYQGVYKNFKIDANNGYLLTFDQFSGNMRNSLEKHNNTKFHAPDTDRTDIGCAQLYKAGWWYHSECYDTLLTGKYKNQSEASTVWSDEVSDYGISWKSVTSKTVNNVRTEVSLKYVAMKVRERNGCAAPEEADLGRSAHTVQQPKYKLKHLVDIYKP